MLRINGYDVNVIEGFNPSITTSENVLGAEMYIQTSQFIRAYEELVVKNIKDGDIIIVANAWNTTTIAMKYILYTMEIDVCMIGCWKDGTYDMNSRIRKGLLYKGKQWAKTFERSLYNAYDHNCFMYESQKEKFMKRYNLKRGSGTCHVIGLPYGHIRSLREKYEPVEKQDIIVLPHDVADEDQRDIWKGLKTEFPDYTFIDCADYKYDLHEYYNILNRAKAMMAINLSESDPTNIYEGMLFGCVPIIPDSLVYGEVFPEKYQYESYYTQPPFLNFVRGREHIHKHIVDTMENYETKSVNLDVEAQELEKVIFRDEPLIELIDNIQKSYDENGSTKFRAKRRFTRR